VGTAGVDIATVRGAGVGVVAVNRLSRLAGLIGTLVTRGSGVVVITGHVIGSVDTSGIGLTRVVSADVAVVTIDGRSGSAGAGRAYIPCGAETSIFAGGRIGNCLAARLEVAGIIGTGVIVVAENGRSRRTPTSGAVVVFRAGILVVTGSCVEGELAPRIGVARVVGTDVLVVAGERAAADTFAKMAVVSGGADVTIVAGSLVHGEEAPCLGVTIVAGTNIVVITGEGQAGLTDAFPTLVGEGAGVAIVTLYGVGQIGASRSRVAGIVGAEVVVVTDQGFTLLATLLGVARFRTITEVVIVAEECLAPLAALGRVTRFTAVAEVAVIAEERFSRLAAGGRVTRFQPVADVLVVADQQLSPLAAGDRVAAFGTVATVVVIADQRLPSGALTRIARVVGGADITIGAGGPVVGVDTAGVGVAGVVGARVAIVADAVRSGCTLPFGTGVPQGTFIAIFARESMMVGEKRTSSGGGLAKGGQANSIRTRLRVGADHQRLTVDLTLVRPLNGVAKEGTVAQIAILQGLTIGIALTIAGDGGACAFAFVASVCDGTWVPVVATARIEFEVATARAITGIVGAGIVVITNDRVADAYAGLAVVCSGTGVAILALAFVEQVG